MNMMGVQTIFQLPCPADMPCSAMHTKRIADGTLSHSLAVGWTSQCVTKPCFTV